MKHLTRDDFLEFRKAYEYAPGARECMLAFEQLRAGQNEAASESLKEARQLYKDEKYDESLAKYREIASRYYASKHYLTANAQVEYIAAWLGNVYYNPRGRYREGKSDNSKE